MQQHLAGMSYNQGVEEGVKICNGLAMGTYTNNMEAAIVLERDRAAYLSMFRKIGDKKPEE